MSKILYNEGRVVGYSAYEIYVRQVLSDDPTATPATEKEWLSSMISMGSSMLLRVGTDTTVGAHYRDIQFPSDCRLGAANTIIASMFIGDGYIGSDVADTANVWATRVTDYGNLISNVSGSAPVGTLSHSGFVPTKTEIDIDNTTLTKLKNYMKITDGIIIQPGMWSTSANQPPLQDFAPTYSDYPRLRLSFADKVTEPFFLLLTGFTNRTVVKGTTASTTATATTAPYDGDFLGPMAFPWAAKVIFSVPPVYMRAYIESNYKRKLPSSGTATSVTSTPIIDMASADPITDYYAGQDTAAPVSQNVTVLDIGGDAAAVLATYIHSDNGTSLPPALYGALVAASGSGSVAPIDAVAPGTVHLYHGDLDSDDANNPVAKAKTLEKKAAGARAFVRGEDDYVVSERDAGSETMIPVAKVSTTSLYGALTSEPRTDPIFYTQGSLRSGITIKWTGQDGNTAHSGGTNYGSSSTVPSENTAYWYLELSDAIKGEYTLETITIMVYDSTAGTWSSSTVQGISGATAAADPMPFCGVGCMIHKRVSGRLSNIIKNTCGYTGVYTYDSGTDTITPAGVFAAGADWANATKDMFGQITKSEIEDYYALIPSSPLVSNAIAWPVHTSDNYLDVTVRYQFKIIINGSAWNIPHFTNNSNANSTSTMHLGSWWNTLAGDRTYNSGTDTYTAEKAVNGWQNINVTSLAHPLVYNTLHGSTTGQIYQLYSMLPTSTTGAKTMTQIFGSTALTAAGILAEYQSMTVTEFLNTAMYTDMGTGKPLSELGTADAMNNILQATTMYTNTSYNINSVGTYNSASALETAYPAASNKGRYGIVTGTQGGNTVYSRYKSNGSAWVIQDTLKSATLCNVLFAFDMPVCNSAATVGKTQLLNVPDAYKDIGSDPVGTVITTGRRQGLVLSMADENNTPYSIYGTAGSTSVSADGNLSWQDLLEGLSKNKKIDILGTILKGLKSNITASGAHYIQFGTSTNAIRLYIAKTAPTDADIPDGSVGIGWASGTVKVYSGGSWS